ncbi:hypothetical protein ACTAQI_19425 [Pseudarthrobacter sp. alpha12b]
MTSASDNLARLVDDMLQDAGSAQDAELRGALFSLGALASLPAPAPTGELAALLTAGVPSPVEDTVPTGQPGDHTTEQLEEKRGEQPADELARRRRRHRPTALGLVLVAGMGLGVGGVAASSTPSGSSAVEHLMEDWAPWSGPAGEPSAAGHGYRAPKVASDGELTAAGSPSAPGGSTDAAYLASRLLPDPAGSSRHTGHGHTGVPACAGPVKHDPANDAGKCTPAAGAASQGGRVGNGKEDVGAGAEGTPAGSGAAGTAKAGLPASDTLPAAADAAGAAQKAAGTAAGAVPAPVQGPSQGTGQGSGPKPTAPAR